MDEIEENTIVCSRCGSVNSAGRFFCYTCGNYFAGTENNNVANGPAKEEQAGTLLSAPRARVIMPGGGEVLLSGTPTFIERSNFDVFRRRVRLPLWEKSWIVWRALVG